jgi:hypothetical protein
LWAAVFYYPPTVSPSAFLVFVYWKFAWISAPCSSPLLQCTQNTLPPLLYVLFQFLVYYSVYLVFFFLFCRAGGVSLSRRLCWFISGFAGSLWDYCMLLICSPVGLLDVSQAGLELVSVIGALLFSQCNVLWRSFVQDGGSGCQSFDSSWCFFSAKCGSSVSVKCLICGAHAVRFCTLVTILDPP